MGWHNPPIGWHEYQRRLAGVDGSEIVVDPLADAGDSAWGRPTRTRYAETQRRVTPGRALTRYAELHCHSYFSFLDGASSPETLVEEAVEQGLTGLAITDHDGLYGAIRFRDAAAEYPGLTTVYGAELSLELPGPQTGEPDPAGSHLMVIARDPVGYRSLSAALGKALVKGGGKGKPSYELEELAALADRRWLILTGCRKGVVSAALRAGDSASIQRASKELDRLTALFGADNVAVELTDHDLPDCDERIDALADLARTHRLPTVATNNVHYATPDQRRLAQVMAAIRARRSLDELDGWLSAGTAHLRSPEEMAARFAAYPDAVTRAADFADECGFDLRLIEPKLPDFLCPDGRTEMEHLRFLVAEGAKKRYADNPDAESKLARELGIIEDLGYPGYFLIVNDIVRFCREKGIYCQGRGSAANSAVCYALGITNVDAVKWNLLFERFISPDRDGPPDIDIDIESDRREEAIQYVYDKYGRDYAAQVANVISYRPRSAIRDVARAFGFSPGQQDAWSKQVDRWSGSATDVAGIPTQVQEYANLLLEAPRHLGIHSGGMVICDRPVTEVVPVEWARMPGRTVVQWDKDDCAATGLVKFDLLGLGMLSAIRYAIEFIRDVHGAEVDTAKLDLADQEVYDLLCAADTVGVFQVESRAQIATLPRLQPRTFYDIVIEVALIRPGPIQGGSVHPYLRRRKDPKLAIPPHPILKETLKRTLGVPLFQEQLMQMAIAIADFSPSEADKLRRAVSSKRSKEKMAELKKRLYDGMAANNVTGAVADDIYLKLASFADFGFPESHAMSFAYIVFQSAWLKRYYPAAFYAALLKAQPMGFYSPQSLAADARRHGVTVLRPCIANSAVDPQLEITHPPSPPPGPKTPTQEWGKFGPAIRLGLAGVRNLSTEFAQRIVAARAERPFQDLADLARRTNATSTQLETLATAGAFESLGLARRSALWSAAAAARDRPEALPGTTAGPAAPMLPGMTELDQVAADVWATGISPQRHPIEFVRPRLMAAGAREVRELRDLGNHTRVSVGGLVTHRQRPQTASGITFLNLEDETGMLNVVCTVGAWKRFRHAALTSPALIIRGLLEYQDNAINLLAERIIPLKMEIPSKSRDFQ